MGAGEAVGKHAFSVLSAAGHRPSRSSRLCQRRRCGARAPDRLARRWRPAPPRSNLAAAAPKTATSRSARKKPRRTFSVERYQAKCSLPLRVTADFGTFADAKKCPDCLRHCVQWQAVADVGATASSKRMLPQWQEPLSPISASILGRTTSGAVGPQPLAHDLADQLQRDRLVQRQLQIALRGA